MSGSKCWPGWAEMPGVATGPGPAQVRVAAPVVVVAALREPRDPAPVERNPWATCLLDKLIPFNQSCHFPSKI